jgi:hypothetical protein
MTPRETAFALSPLEAYSIASDLVTAVRPPLVNVASAAGASELAYSTSIVDTLTT